MYIAVLTKGTFSLSLSWSSSDTLSHEQFYQEEDLLVGSLTIPPFTVGNNGHFIARFYDEWHSVRSNLPRHILGMEVCLNGSGAVTFIEYEECDDPDALGEKIKTR